MAEHTVLEVACPFCGAREGQHCGFPGAVVVPHAEREMLFNQVVQPSDPTMRERQTYHENTGAAYLKMAERPRYSLSERGEFALTAAEHLIRAAALEDELRRAQ